MSGGYLEASERASNEAREHDFVHGPTLHVKVTEHFLDSLRARPMGLEASQDLWALISGRDLHRITCQLRPGQRGALAVAGDGHFHLVIFCRDEVDPAVCALLTVLSEDEAQVVARRRDTILCSLRR